MRELLTVVLLGLIPVFSFGQSENKRKEFGFAINSSVNGELYPIRLVPSLIYFKGNSQLELGAGFNISDRQTQKLLSGELNYKYFPNSNVNKISMYLLARVSYVNRERNTYYPTEYNYVFINGGYGFEIKVSEKVFLGTNMSVGAFSFSKKSEIPYDTFKSQSLLDEIGLNLAFQFNVGYRL